MATASLEGWVSSRGGSAALGLESSQGEGGFNAAGVIVLFGIDAAAVEALDFDLAVGNGNLAEVVGVWTKPFNVWAHAVNAHGASLDGHQKGVLIVFAHDVRGQVSITPLQHEIWVCGGVFGFQGVVGGLQRCLQRANVRLGEHHHAFRFPGNGVSQTSSMNFRHPQVDVVQGFQQNAVHEFVRVGQAFVDVHAAVAARRATEHEAHGGIAVLHGFFLRVGPTRRQVDATGAPDADLVVVLGVQVQKDVATQESPTLSQCPGHPRFFVDGEERLKRGVGDVGAFQHGQNAGHPNTVVRTQRGAVLAGPNRRPPP